MLTLRRALSLALMQNPELAAFSWEVRASEVRTFQAGLFPNPEIGVEVENFAGTGAASAFDATETTIRFSQLVLLGGKRNKRMRVAALERDLAGWDYETKRVNVLSQVAKRFVQVLAAQRRLTLTQQTLDLAKQVLGVVTQRVQAGKVSPVERTKAQVAFATARIEFQRAQRQLKATRQKLTATWGGSTPRFSQVSGNLDSISPIPALEALADRISQNPELARWVAEMVKRQQEVDLAKAQAIPDLTASAGLRRLNETDDTAFVVEFSLPLPLFNRNQGGILEARYNIAKAEEARRSAEIRVRTALSETYQRLDAAFQAAKGLKEEVLPGATSAFSATQEAFRLGKVGFLDVLDAQRTLIDARRQHVDALASYHLAVTEVERLISEPLGQVMTGEKAPSGDKERWSVQ